MIWLKMLMSRKKKL